MWSDPVADMLTRVRNGLRMHKKMVSMPCSKLKIGVARVLLEEGYIRGYDTVADTKQGILRIELKFGPRGEDVIHRLRRESKPGCRV